MLDAEEPRGDPATPNATSSQDKPPLLSTTDATMLGSEELRKDDARPNAEFSEDVLFLPTVDTPMIDAEGPRGEPTTDDIGSSEEECLPLSMADTVTLGTGEQTESSVTPNAQSFEGGISFPQTMNAPTIDAREARGASTTPDMETSVEELLDALDRQHISDLGEDLPYVPGVIQRLTRRCLEEHEQRRQTLDAGYVAMSEDKV